MQVTEKLLDKARDRRKTLKKRKRKTKNDKKSNNKYHFIFTSSEKPWLMLYFIKT